MQRIGDLFAVLAAASNGTIGIFNRYGFSDHTNYISIAFFKCFGAFLLLSLVLLVRPPIAAAAKARRKAWPQLAVLAFFGIFVLYFFETWAFSLTSIPVVSFLTYASGILAVLLGIFVLKEEVTLAKAVATGLVFAGTYLIFGGLRNGNVEVWGAILAVVGGAGYSIFLFLWRKFQVPSGVATLWWFFGFGTIFLAVPFFFSGAPIPDRGSWLSIAALIGIPTLGGYYFTGRALSMTEASRVQVIETSDPIFSSLFAFVLLGETLSGQGLVGAAAVFGGIVLLILAPQTNR